MTKKVKHNQNSANYCPKQRQDLKLTSGFAKYPSGRDDFFNKSAETWIHGKRKDDGAFPYWRIHDKLYDLKKFASKHPGGKFWIEATQGTDITEAFEASHFGNVPNKLLDKFFVKDVHTPRNSPFTFEEDGFYKTFRRKADPILKKAGTGPSWKSLAIQDFAFSSFLILLVFGILRNSVSFVCISSIFLFLSTNSAHNFLHQRDNWRMFYFDFMILSSQDWRYSHVLSHHLFPNTIHDFEITGLEPFFEVLPKQNKTLCTRYGPFVFGNLVYPFGFFIDALRKLTLALRQKLKFRVENLIPLLQLIVMAAIRRDLQQALWLWIVLHSCANVLFLVHGVAVGHHHPHIFREGDLASPNKDWGTHQVIVTKTRSGVSNSFVWASFFFGNHILHHLLPTVDHSKLPLVASAYKQTCKEFGMKIEYYSYWKLLSGFYLSNLSTIPNQFPPACLK